LLVVAGPLFPDCGHPCGQLTLTVPEHRFDLEIVVLILVDAYLFFGLGLFGLVDYRHCFELIETTQIPTVGVTLTDWLA